MESNVKRQVLPDPNGFPRKGAIPDISGTSLSSPSSGGCGASECRCGSAHGFPRETGKGASVPRGA